MNLAIAEKRAVLRAYDTGVNVADVAPKGSTLYGWPEREHAQVTIARPDAGAVSIPAATLEEWRAELAPTSMPLDAIIPLIREVGHLRERGEYQAAAELEERIRQPITVAGRVLEPCGDRDMRWYHSDVMLTARCDEWCAVLTTHGEPDTAIQVQTQGRGPTIAAALSDAHARYQAAVADTLLRMGGLLREVVL